MAPAVPRRVPSLPALMELPAQWKGKDTGRRRTPKEDIEAVLARPHFRESDGPEIVNEALRQGLLDRPDGSNRSYSEFVRDLTAWPVERRAR